MIVPASFSRVCRRAAVGGLLLSIPLAMATPAFAAVAAPTATEGYGDVITVGSSMSVAPGTRLAAGDRVTVSRTITRDMLTPPAEWVANWHHDSWTFDETITLPSDNVADFEISDVTVDGDGDGIADPSLTISLSRAGTMHIAASGYFDDDATHEAEVLDRVARINIRYTLTYLGTTSSAAVPDVTMAARYSFPGHTPFPRNPLPAIAENATSEAAPWASPTDPWHQDVRLDFDAMLQTNPSNPWLLNWYDDTLTTLAFPLVVKSSSPSPSTTSPAPSSSSPAPSSSSPAPSTSSPAPSVHAPDDDSETPSASASPGDDSATPDSSESPRADTDSGSPDDAVAPHTDSASAPGQDGDALAQTGGTNNTGVAIGAVASIGLGAAAVAIARRRTRRS